MKAAEDAAREAGRWLLVLDTATPEAERLYARAGWKPVGVVPDYAMLPDGELCDTVFFYKRLNQGPLFTNSATASGMSSTFGKHPMR